MGRARILNLLQPAPHLPRIEDPVRVKKEFRYWRLRIFYSMYIGYFFYYFTRKSLTSITPFLVQDLKLSMSDIGWIGTTLSIAYGVSKFTSGVLCDRSNPRYFMAFGLILTGFANIFFGCFSSIIMLCIFWGLNGLFQGWGWPACTKQLTHWFSRSERGTWWSICSTSYTLGGVLIAYLAVYCAQLYGWRFGMFVPGFICIFAGLWLLNRLRDVPQSLGLPTVEEYRGEAIPETDFNKENIQAMTVKQILFEQVLNNKYIWILGFSYFFVYFMRTAIDGSFVTLYLTQTKEFTPLQAASCVAWFEIGGFFGILVSGWSSDYLFQGRRIPLIVMSSLVLFFAIMGLWYFTPGSFIQGSILMTTIGFLVFIPQMLVGLAAAEFVSKKAAGASNGFASCLAHLGAAAAGFPLGRITELYGWYGFIFTLIICAAIVFLVLLPIWSMRSKDHEEVVLEEAAVDATKGEEVVASQKLIEDPDI